MIHHFDGPETEPNTLARDKRLTRQIGTVEQLMGDGRWRSLSEIAQATGHPEASISARLRDLRKERFGGYTVERRYVRKGLHEYRVVKGARP